MARLFLLLVAFAATAQAANRTVVVTGATGRSGSKVYLLLKSIGANVRGLVRNVTKARQILGCSRCDASEGIFVGDITNKESLVPAMSGAGSLVIATGRSTNEHAKDIIFDGIESQVSAFLASPGPSPQDRHISLISMALTTLPDTFWNKMIARLWGGWDVGFYSLNSEAALMSANVPFTILKACGLDETPPGQNHILVGHDDKGWKMKDAHSVSRHDVARVLATAATNPSMAANLRFDFCSQQGTPQLDAIDILKEAMMPWDTRRQGTTAPKSTMV
jgi:hypothetical protein